MPRYIDPIEGQRFIHKEMRSYLTGTLIFSAIALFTRRSFAFSSFRSLSLSPKFVKNSSISIVNRKMASNSEVDAAAIAASTDPAINPNAPTFFDKIVSGQIPAKVIYEDELCMAFRDINPQVRLYNAM